MCARLKKNNRLYCSKCTCTANRIAQYFGYFYRAQVIDQKSSVAPSLFAVNHKFRRVYTDPGWPLLTQKPIDVPPTYLYSNIGVREEVITAQKNILTRILIMIFCEPRKNTIQDGLGYYSIRVVVPYILRVSRHDSVKEAAPIFNFRFRYSTVVFIHTAGTLQKIPNKSSSLHIFYTLIYNLGIK